MLRSSGRRRNLCCGNLYSINMSSCLQNAHSIDKATVRRAKLHVDNLLGDEPGDLRCLREWYDPLLLKHLTSVSAGDALVRRALSRVSRDKSRCGWEKREEDGQTNPEPGAHELFLSADV